MCSLLYQQSLWHGGKDRQMLAQPQQMNSHYKSECDKPCFRSVAMQGQCGVVLNASIAHKSAILLEALARNKLAIMNPVDPSSLTAVPLVSPMVTGVAYAMRSRSLQAQQALRMMRHSTLHVTSTPLLLLLLLLALQPLHQCCTH
jgi:hypothetical protein